MSCFHLESIINYMTKIAFTNRMVFESVYKVEKECEGW